MNIFVLHTNQRICAKYHCDKHVISQIKEYAQLLSTAHRVLDKNRNVLCEITHVNHPCAKWVRQCDANYQWLYLLLKELCKEYTYRYEKIHLYERNGLLNYLRKSPTNIRYGNLTQFALAMPEEHQTSSAVWSYRSYYAYAKKKLLQYKKRKLPLFLRRRIVICGGRDYSDWKQLRRICDKVLLPTDTIICGKAAGADYLGERYAKYAGLAYEEYPADWRLHGKAAGYIRNKEMIITSTHVLAFWDGKSRGTKHSIALSHTYKRHLLIIRY